MILIKDGAPLWKKAFAKFSALFKTDVNTKDYQREVGVRAMLPNMVQELQNGTRLKDCITHISEVIHRQIEHLSGHPFKYSYYYWETERREKERKAKRIVEKVSIIVPELSSEDITRTYIYVGVDKELTLKTKSDECYEDF